ncbi:MAG: efflux RND transporter permease subunit [Phycisphaerales bacterium]
MKLVSGSVRQPVTVVVAVLLVALAGLIALQRLPIQLTPTVASTVVSVNTFWEGASPSEVERSIVEKQEEKLQGVAGVVQMTSVSAQNSGRVRLEFAVGTDPDAAIREVSDKLRQVQSYPPNADQPVVEASDPENKDYIAWIVLEGGGGTGHAGAFDIRTLQDFAEDRVKPRLERVPGVSEINVLGGRERELQVRFDAERLAQRGLTVDDLVSAIGAANRNASAGSVREAKNEVSVRAVGQFESPEAVEAVVVATREGRPILVGDVAEAVLTYKKPSGFVRSAGRPVIAINVQQEVGTNIVEVMRGVRAAVAEMNGDGGLLAAETARRGLEEDLRLKVVYDQTTYIDDAIALVRDNIWQGGLLATITLLLFLRSWRAIAIIGIAIPISLIGTVVVLLALGRTVNVISLAGLAFAVGMLVDNAIVVLENIWRHMEMGKGPARASIDATSEVWGAILGSTLTTVVVFVPILLIEDEVGQLFRDIAIALSVSVLLSMLVAITVVPTAAARLLKPLGSGTTSLTEKGWLGRLSTFTARSLYRVSRRRALALGGALVLTLLSVAGSVALVPPRDYLPRGNRNLVFGLILPPPGTSLEQQTVIAERVEETVRPYWEAGRLPADSDERASAEAALPSVPVAPWMAWKVGPTIQPSAVENYFVVSFPGAMFHGGVSADPARAGANEYLLNHATRGEVLPGTLAFAFQVPLFRTSGSSGSAVRIDFKGDDLDAVTNAAGATFGSLMGAFGPGSVQPDPPSFNLPGPEVRLTPDHRALAEAGLSPAQLAIAVLAAGDGTIVGEYRLGGESIDLKVVDRHAAEAAAAVASRDLGELPDTPVATPMGRAVQLRALASVERGTAPTQINHVDRQRAVSLQVTAPPTMALDEAIRTIESTIEEGRRQGAIPAGVRTELAGSASKLAEIQRTLFGDGTVTGFLTSSMFLALLVCYLVMVVLFQSFLLPLVILFSVPLACVGGFAALMAVFLWSLSEPLMPMQTLDVLTMLGFVVLIGVVVNNAILIVHQARNFMRGEGDETPSDLAFRGLPGAPTVGKGVALPAAAAIAESVRTRIRPILMSSLTSVTGLLPLILAPGAGSELYRGLGAVVAGGLLVSTIFTIVLVPLVLSFVLRDARPVSEAREGP